ncbi:Phosphopantetheine adenylyltransferase [bioreactor metagenome]|uniref:Phosphopantetheine adenylyltransferase n=1 Tax=bioreactor metagenome TaxID=1076179 RepID=A0A645EXT9_9ZZZZ
MRVCVYPGSFDPFTVGHHDVLEHAAQMFDRVVIAVLNNASKSPVLSVKERVDMISSMIEAEELENVVVSHFEGLLVDYAHQIGADYIVRGLRATMDFEYEFQINALNRHLAQDIKTVYFMASPEHSFLSSSVVREIGSLGGNIEGLVPESIHNIIAERLKKP